VAQAPLAATKKGALKRGAWLLHLDETGFSQQPSVRRTWAPQGRTPIVKMAFNWKRLSGIGALAVSPDLRRVRTFLSLQPGSVNGPAVVSFLRSVRRHLRAPVLLVWDRLPAHRSAVVRDYLDSQRHWLDVEWLPAYAPELNPLEYLWSYLDSTDLANFAPDDLGELSSRVHRAKRRVHRSPDVAFGFLKHSGLYPEL